MQNVDFLNLQAIFYKIYQLLSNLSLARIMDFITRYWPLIAIISFILSIILLIFVIYFTFKLKEVEKKDEKLYGEVIELDGFGEGESIKNERWLKVLEHLEQESPAEWRTAIMEADIILDEMTIKMGYHGDNLGERLRGVEKSDFTTLDLAWEAHKVRNAIAHEGSDYILTKRETKRVIDLFRQVFEEFEFI